MQASNTKANGTGSEINLLKAKAGLLIKVIEPGQTSLHHFFFVYNFMRGGVLLAYISAGQGCLVPVAAWRVSDPVEVELQLAVSWPMGADPQPFLKPKKNMPFALADHLQGTEKKDILRVFEIEVGDRAKETLENRYSKISYPSVCFSRQTLYYL